MTRVLSVLRAAASSAVVWRVIGDLQSTGIPARLEWRGSLQGSPDAMRDVDEFLTTEQQVPITPTGPYLKADKHDEQSAYAIALYLLGGADVTGDPPDLPWVTLPEGAIA